MSERYKPGQGSFARLTTNVAVLVTLFLGCVELYSWIQSPDDTSIIPGGASVFEDLPLLGVPLSYKLLICVALFIGSFWLVRRWINKPAAVDALIETEMEMKKVSWPTMPEARTATWVVVLVTVLMTASLAFFDYALVTLFDFVFDAKPN
jgi:preprotein translocase SecE subunit